MRAETVATEVQFPHGHEVVQIDYKPGRLSLKVQAVGDVKAATVVFPEVAGFRVLDEGDLLEFWPTCSKPNGWLFRILDGGWFSLESTRQGFSGLHTKKVSEYLVTGDEDCVSVLAWEAPRVIGSAL